VLHDGSGEVRSNGVTGAVEVSEGG
jgi:hypothetical protein